MARGEIVEGFMYGMKWGVAKTALTLGAAGMLFQGQPLVILTNRTVYVVETRRAGSWEVKRVVARYPRGTVSAVRGYPLSRTWRIDTSRLDGRVGPAAARPAERPSLRACWRPT
ncbi:MAG: hypothetical protein LC775_05935, partial [Acidobacteria bacterium]|nr:hypothetical protein [Acidobacteriota bacterium]